MDRDREGQEDLYPHIPLQQVIVRVQEYNKDLGSPMKKECSALHLFLKAFLSPQGEPEVLYLDQDQEEYMRLDPETKEDDLVMITKRGKRQAELQIIYTKAPKTFDERAFFKNDGSIKSIRKRENEVDFPQLRIPQEESLMQLRQTMRSTNVSQFLVVMPTGVGKTVVMALAPFALDVNNKVLILTPTVLLKEQITNSIRSMYNKRFKPPDLKAHPIGRTGDVDALISEYDSRNLDTLKSSDVIVANVQQLAKGVAETESGKVFELYDKAKDNLSQLKIDLVIVDEGHHSAATSWKTIISEVVDKNPDVKFLFVTATPQRTDGIKYCIEDKSQLYLCERSFAQSQQIPYIKHTKPYGIDLSDELKMQIKTIRKDKVKLYSNDVYVKQIMEPAVKTLLELRKTCQNYPLRMLVFARTNENGENLAAQINNLSSVNKWGLHAEDVRGSKRDDAKSVHARFSCSRHQYESVLKKQYKDKPFVDIVVQVNIFGEGYDNDWIAVTTLVAPKLSLNSLAQGHGRALRAPPKDMINVNSPRKWEAHLFYPKIGDHQKIVEDYMKGVDEDENSIVSPFGKNPLSSAHKRYLRVEREKGTDEAIKDMKQMASHYHVAYRERRENWKSIPAENLASKIFKELIATPSALATRDVHFTFKLIDFGCGEDLLFEKKLWDLVSDHNGSGHIDILGVDVEEYVENELGIGAGIEERGQLTFSHIGLACNYYELEDQERFKRWHGDVDIDAAIFCLSLMLRESVPEGLIAAINVVKFGGPIYIVLDVTKFGLNFMLNRRIKEKALSTWKDKFIKACGRLLTVRYLTEFDHDGMVYMELKNVSSDEERRALIGKLREPPPTTLGSLRLEDNILNDIKESVSRKRHSSGQD